MARQRNSTQYPSCNALTPVILTVEQVAADVHLQQAGTLRVSGQGYVPSNQRDVGGQDGVCLQCKACNRAPPVWDDLTCIQDFGQKSWGKEQQDA